MKAPASSAGAADESKLKKSTPWTRAKDRANQWINRPIAPRFWGPRHMDHLVRKLERNGIRSKVTFYGSARGKSPEEAHDIYEKALQQFREYVNSPNTEDFKKAKESLQEAAIAVNEARYYAMARRLGKRNAAETHGRTLLISGAGPGPAMQATLEGAAEVPGSTRLGLNINLAHEQHTNPYVTHSQTYNRFDDRQADLREYSNVMVYFPGGVGTGFELYENLTLLQNQKAHPWRPDLPPPLMILLGPQSEWEHMLSLRTLYDHRRISKKNISLTVSALDEEEAWKLMKPTLDKLNADPAPQPGFWQHLLQVIVWRLKSFLG